LTPTIQGGSRMRESRTYGFVRGVLGDQHPYRDSQPFWFGTSLPIIQCKTSVVDAFRRMSRKPM